MHHQQPILLHGTPLAIGGERTFFIAEIGKNFIQSQEERPVEEYLTNAIALVRAAKDAGADAVKFQTHTVADEQANIEVVAPHFKGADRYRWVSRNEAVTPFETFWKPLKAACDEIGIIFFTTPMSRGAAQKVAPLQPALWKVGSGDVLDFVCLDYLRSAGKPILISSGMSTIEEIDATIAFLKEKTDQIVLLHCVSRYPCPPEDLRLGTMALLKTRFDVTIGFSDHSIGGESAVVAAALGAAVIEKHFSFDRAFWGSDHKVSMRPEEYRAMVAAVRALEADPAERTRVLASDIARRATQEEDKVLQDEEAVFRPLFRKTLVVAVDLSAGTVIAPEHVYAMRPHAYLPGLPSETYATVVGRVLARSVSKYEPLVADDLVP